MHLLFCAHFTNIFFFRGLELRHFFLFKMLKWCLVCVICNSNSFQTLHNDCSYIEHRHLLFCAHLINIFLFLGLLNVDMFPSKMLRGCLVCVICNSSSFHSFIFKLSVMIVRTLNMCTIFCAHLITYFGVLNLDIITSTPPLECLNCNLCVICISNRFHSFIFKLCIMIAHTLKMCTDDAGLEQSLVLLCSCANGPVWSFLVMVVREMASSLLDVHQALSKQH